MDGVELMNRTDTKFILTRSSLEEILSAIQSSYRILEVNGLRQSRYETLYYDTPAFKFYRGHQNGKRNRYKIRKRSYLDSNLNFLEVKFKSNKDRTIKDRTKLPLLAAELEPKHSDFIQKTTEKEFDLEPKIWNRFTRITLVNESLPERLTIDCDLNFTAGSNRIALPQLVIAELKQERQNRYSPFMVELKKRHIRPEGFSKYCMGVALLYPEMKSNTFKEKILKIKKLQNGIAA